MKKKFLVLMLVAILVVSNWCSVSAATLYAADGRKIEVADYKVQEWVNVGWHEGVKLYAPDGRNITVSPFDAQKWIDVGWYRAVELYSPNADSVLVSPFDTQTWINVGWYTYPVVNMYNYAGNKIVVAKSEISSYMAKGWTLTHNASGQELATLIKYLQEAASNDSKAIECLTNYLKYDISSYKTLFWSYLNQSYEATKKAYAMSLEYSNLNPISENLARNIAMYEDIKAGNHSIYSMTKPYGEIIKNDTSILAYLKTLG